MREFNYVFAAIALIFTVIAVRVDAAIVPVAHPKWLEDEFSHSEELDKKDPQLALDYLMNVVAENPNLAGYDLAFAYAHLARYASFVGLLDKTLNYVELAKAAYPNYTEHLAIELLLSESEAKCLVRSTQLLTNLDLEVAFLESMCKHTI